MKEYLANPEAFASAAPAASDAPAAAAEAAPEAAKEEEKEESDDDMVSLQGCQKGQADVQGFGLFD